MLNSNARLVYRRSAAEVETVDRTVISSDYRECRSATVSGEGPEGGC